jgi:hypothetical protein
MDMDVSELLTALEGAVISAPSDFSVVDRSYKGLKLRTKDGRVFTATNITVESVDFPEIVDEEWEEPELIPGRIVLRFK